MKLTEEDLRFLESQVKPGLRGLPGIGSLGRLLAAYRQQQVEIAVQEAKQLAYEAADALRRHLLRQGNQR